ncbi:MAG: phosphoribosylanthranilate isomerase [Flavobacteriales bacterium]
MKDPENVENVKALEPDYLGFIFHPASPRFIDDFECIKRISGVKKVGVFVNAAPAEVLRIFYDVGLDMIQLHGNENPEYCGLLKGYGLKLVKAFSVGRSFDFSITNFYAPFCEYFLFDAAGPNRGGNGIVFNWMQLKFYCGKTRFFLSGGIGPEHVDLLQALRKHHPLLHGIDLNSRFEYSPGLKSIELLSPFVSKLKLSCHEY